MGILTLALIANGNVPAGTKAQFWVILSCALAISSGTYAGGWRVIRTLGSGLVSIESPQGMAAESASAASLLLATHFGYALSTTHVSTGSLLGAGVGREGAKVRRHVAGRMVITWLIALPIAALIGAAAYVAAVGVGATPGVLVVLAVLVALAATSFVRSRGNVVNASNVNDDWPASATPTTGPTVAAAAPLGDQPQAAEYTQTRGVQTWHHYRCSAPSSGFCVPATPKGFRSRTTSRCSHCSPGDSATKK